MALHILSGGAAKGLVEGVREDFRAQHHVTIEGEFSAVGVMRDKLVGGAPCDVIILTAALIGELGVGGHVLPETAMPLGTVETAVAVPAGQPAPDIASTASLAAAFFNAAAIHVPDMTSSTAGRHVRAMLERLGIAAAVAGRVREFPNGETAMRALALEAKQGAIGCTQITEINNTPGLTCAGKLPSPFELGTVYVAAVTARAADPERARALVALMAGDSARALRLRCGFAAEN